jgi:hypothetical protein
VPEVPGDEQVRQACAYLRMLLLRPGEYRTTWERQLDDTDPASISYRAVGRVLGSVARPPAGHGIARSSGAATRSAGVTASATAAATVDDLAGLAQRALEGDELTAEVLELFIDGFGLGDRHARRLRELLRGSSTVRVISGHAMLPPDLLRTDGVAGHETLALHELHILGPDGLPAEHQTIQVIKSTVGRLERMPYRFDTDELVVEVIRGGHVGDEIYRIGTGLYGVDIMLAQPLPLGETALMQLRTTFFYKSPPPPEFRRGVMRATRDLTIWVRFHPSRVPARVWAARWDRLDQARIIDRQAVELDGELSVHSRFEAVERAIVGFTWEWE